MRRWLWPALASIAALLAFVVLALVSSNDPVVRSDDPLPDLPAVTLEGVALDAAFFGDRPWVILVWLPG